MKRYFSMWLIFVLFVSSLPACATDYAKQMNRESDSDFYKKPGLSDEIVAVVLPDEKLKTEIGNDSVICIGLKHSYALEKGGSKLAEIAQLDLDPNLLAVSGANKYIGEYPFTKEYEPDLYFKDDQVWGTLFISYKVKSPLTENEIASLTKAGFELREIDGGNKQIYWIHVRINGKILPKIEIPKEQLEEQLSKLKVRRTIEFYPSKDTTPPKLGNLSRLTLATATDVAFAPVYAVAFLGGVVLFIPSLFLLYCFYNCGK